MGTTANGYPYPEDSDPVAQGAQAIKDLAQQIEVRLKSLAANVAEVHLTSDAFGTVAVTFPSGRFATTPEVVASCSNSVYFAAVQAITLTGVTLAVRHYQNINASTDVPVHWIAKCT